MTTFAPDTAAPPTQVSRGPLLALASAVSFGLAGPLAAGLLRAGWSPTAAVIARVGIAGLVMLPAAARVVRGRPGILRRGGGTIVAYGVAAIAATQLGFFLAVTRLPVATALLIEYLAPVVVLAWAWLVHGRRPSRLTVLGAVVALAGLVPVLGLTGGAGLDPVGVGFALVALCGLVVYFLLSAGGGEDLPPFVLTCGGTLVGAVMLGAVAACGLLPFAASTAPAVYAGIAVPWWVAVGALGVIAAAVAYTTGIGAARALGARAASFVGLSEVLFAATFAALLVGQAPTLPQILGGFVVLAGIAMVQAGDDTTTVASAVEPPAATASQEPGERVPTVVPELPRLSTRHR
ncbi:EamA family transporter [Mobilicoccus pelagius]|uniref:EamA domain-containing protein n=1 Tax=Mobilicoccus pelagius NBRC 104925 TaxID=1089455 RepID=H5UMN1_9MICO|nr:EamA family transporter [Mobilicoccus pelagius]GAB46989.1 hypothetical protein MOPEL_003_00120 [Mobilicoccus pelagius NBRC 104925]